jgi:hypothetical protein
MLAGKVAFEASRFSRHCPEAKKEAIPKEIIGM